MHRRHVRVLICTAVTVAIVCIAVGCGGGGGGGTPTPPSPPPSPPPVEIGPGPGPAASSIPTEPAISTVSARATAFADAPRADLARAEAIARIDAFADSPPATEADLRTVLADFTGWVSQEPNDPVSQAGLALATVVAGAYNAGIDAGYTPNQVLSLLEPITQVAAAGLVGTTAEFPNPGDADFSSADLQIGVRRFLLPAIVHARERLDAVANAAAGPGTRLAEFPSHRGTHYAYRAEFRALSSLLRGVQAVLLQLCAYQFNPGTWDWTVPLADRDANGDGLLRVAEYLPPDPFGWRADADNMTLSGQHLTAALETLHAALAEAPDDSLLVHICADGRQAELTRLSDLQALIDHDVQVRIDYEGGSSGAGSFATRMRIRRLWEAPSDDLKTLFPTLAPVSGSYWEALPRGVGDFPRPQLGGVFPEPTPVLEMRATGPTYIAVSYGSLERLTIIDRRGQ